jgi:uncharacterized membrane protein (UPF0182 family)
VLFASYIHREVYWLILLGLLGLGSWILRSGIVSRRRSRIIAGVCVVAASLLFFALLRFWSEMFWFESVDYSARFWRMVGARLGTVLLFATIAGLVSGLLCGPLLGVVGRAARRGGMLAGVVAGSLLGIASWDELLLFLNRVDTGVVEPILGLDTGFYLFVLPLLSRVFALLAFVTLGAMALTLSMAIVSQPDGVILLRGQTITARLGVSSRPLRRASLPLAAVAALGMLLARYQLLYSEWGVVAGPGWTDTHVRLPAYGIVALVTLVLGAIPLVPWFEGRLRLALGWGRQRLELGALATVWLSIAAVWLFALVLVPNLVQFLVVEPNEISFEKPYIAHNIEFTRRGFRLHEVEVRQFPAAEELTREVVQDSQHLLSEARLWDVRALDAVYRQFQEIRLYYAFHDVDIDRYELGDRYRQVMVSARELEQRNLPEQSQTFVNQRFKYTHGYGLTLATVRDFTPDGLPNLLVKDIPPRTEIPELRVEQPQIYYGELTGDPAIVNSREPEFDYPSGDENVSTVYSGTGGVLLENLWRKFVLGWRFDGTQFFFSAYMTPETRIQFHRRVQDRVATLAPFLELDEDPYIVVEDGRLYWILDAYTTSEHYPYSEPFEALEQIEYGPGDQRERWAGRVASSLHGANYVRNSVKVVVDAYDGTTTLYAFDAEDPVLRAWRGAFPGLFRDAAEMPAGLRKHVRYPDGFLLTQGLVYAKYHMADPEVFYNQEDLWVRATEKYYKSIQPVEPYYVMWQLPGSERAEFVAILPFTPKNRQVMIGWIAGMCDGDNYGRFLAYKFPKERRILGPQQVETKIDQDRFLSGQLTLWDQRGSSVIRGNVIAIPIGDTLLYVEPIYLQAETAAYPELRLVVVMHGDNLSYAETFEAALEGLFEDASDNSETSEASDAIESHVPREATSMSLRERARAANEVFERYIELQGQSRFSEAGRELERLQSLLRSLSSGDEKVQTEEEP